MGWVGVGVGRLSWCSGPTHTHPTATRQPLRTPAPCPRRCPPHVDTSALAGSVWKLTVRWPCADRVLTVCTLPGSVWKLLHGQVTLEEVVDPTTGASSQ